eukprot:4864156-Pyramimonas_sp.AAC.1
MFNHIVGVDLFYVPLQERTLASLNVVDHGSNLQVCVRVEEPAAAQVWGISRRRGSARLEPFISCSRTGAPSSK